MGRIGQTFSRDRMVGQTFFRNGQDRSIFLQGWVGFWSSYLQDKSKILWGWEELVKLSLGEVGIGQTFCGNRQAWSSLFGSRWDPPFLWAQEWLVKVYKGSSATGQTFSRSSSDWPNFQWKWERLAKLFYMGTGVIHIEWTKLLQEQVGLDNFSRTRQDCTNVL